MRLQVSCVDRVGLARDILEILEKQNININAIDASHAEQLCLKISPISFEQLQVLMSTLRRINGVLDVKTISYMPAEREHYTMEALLTNLPDPIFAIDLKGKVTLVNDSILSILNLERDQVIDQPIANWVQGFSFSRWFSLENVQPQSIRVAIMGPQYLAEILPINLPDLDGSVILAGAMVVLKSPARVSKQLNALREQNTGFECLVTQSDKMRHLVAQACNLAHLDAPLLIWGETGTGKQLLAKACHDASPRRDKPFVVINCASLDVNSNDMPLFDQILDDGAIKPGLIEQVDGGTVVFENVSELSSELQAKLLQLIEMKDEYRNIDLHPDSRKVRVICTCQQDLSLLCQQGEFREDLYYNISVLTLHSPALRQRKADIVPLAELYLEHYSQQFDSSLRQLSPRCRDFMKNYTWPGNVRQLKNAIFRAVSSMDGHIELSPEMLGLPDLEDGFHFGDQDLENTTLDAVVKQFEASVLRKLYPSYPSTRQLARKLGVSHTAIANKLREYGIGKSKR